MPHKSHIRPWGNNFDPRETTRYKRAVEALYEHLSPTPFFEFDSKIEAKIAPSTTVDGLIETPIHQAVDRPRCACGHAECDNPQVLDKYRHHGHNLTPLNDSGGAGLDGAGTAAG